jgi:hypothetical protein
MTAKPGAKALFHHDDQYRATLHFFSARQRPPISLLRLKLNYASVCAGNRQRIKP